MNYIQEKVNETKKVHYVTKQWKAMFNCVYFN